MRLKYKTVKGQRVVDVEKTLKQKNVLTLKNYDKAVKKAQKVGNVHLIETSREEFRRMNRRERLFALKEVELLRFKNAEKSEQVKQRVYDSNGKKRTYTGYIQSYKKKMYDFVAKIDYSEKIDLSKKDTTKPIYHKPNYVNPQREEMFKQNVAAMPTQEYFKQTYIDRFSRVYNPSDKIQRQALAKLKSMSPEDIYKLQNSGNDFTDIAFWYNLSSSGIDSNPLSELSEVLVNGTSV